MTRFVLTFAAFLTFAAAPAQAQSGASLTAVPGKEAVPSELAAPIAQVLAPDGVQVTANKTTLDFWWVKALSGTSGGAAPSWADVPEGTLIGAVRLSSDFRDIRGRIIKAGVYTLRYGLQPQNGDHLGVSPYREFLLISPAGVDTDPAPRGHEGTIELSTQSVGGSHPGVWSLDPPVASGKPLQPLRTEAGHDAVIMEVPVGRDGKPSGSLKFGLILIGKIEA